MSHSCSDHVAGAVFTGRSDGGWSDSYKVILI
jgi:hypothetical protein